MGDLLDRPDFTNNVGLQAMRNAWREKHVHFDQDRVPVPGSVIDVIADAEARMVRLRQTEQVLDSMEDSSTYESPEGFSGAAIVEPPYDSMGALRKICEVCHEPSRNNPCDACYQMGREALEPDWGFGLSTKFCIVCFDSADAQGKLCATCRVLFDGQTEV